MLNAIRELSFSQQQKLFGVQYMQAEFRNSVYVS